MEENVNVAGMLEVSEENITLINNAIAHLKNSTIRVDFKNYFIKMWNVETILHLISDYLFMMDKKRKWHNHGTMISHLTKGHFL